MTPHREQNPVGPFSLSVGKYVVKARPLKMSKPKWLQKVRLVGHFGGYSRVKIGGKPRERKCAGRINEEADFLKFGFASNGEAADDQNIVRGLTIEKLPLFPSSRKWEIFPKNAMLFGQRIYENK